MRYWNYRIVKYANEDCGYGLHEMYYDDNGKEDSMTKNPASFTGDSVSEIHEAMMKARVDAIKRPVFEEPENWNDES